MLVLLGVSSVFFFLSWKNKTSAGDEDSDDTDLGELEKDMVEDIVDEEALDHLNEEDLPLEEEDLEADFADNPELEESPDEEEITDREDTEKENDKEKEKDDQM